MIVLLVPGLLLRQMILAGLLDAHIEKELSKIKSHIVDYAIGDVLHPEFFMYIPNKDFRYSDLFIIIFSSGMMLMHQAQLHQAS